MLTNNQKTKQNTIDCTFGDTNICITLSSGTLYGYFGPKLPVRHEGPYLEPG